jgi:hypothetical protein
VRLPVPAYASGGGCVGQSVRDGGSPCSGIDGGGKDGGGKRCSDTAQVSRWAEALPMSSCKLERTKGM